MTPNIHAEKEVTKTELITIWLTIRLTFGDAIPNLKVMKFWKQIFLNGIL